MEHQVIYIKNSGWESNITDSTLFADLYLADRKDHLKRCCMSNSHSYGTPKAGSPRKAQICEAIMQSWGITDGAKYKLLVNWYDTSVSALNRRYYYWIILHTLVCSVALLLLVRPVVRLGNPRFLVFFLVPRAALLSLKKNSATAGSTTALCLCLWVQKVIFLGSAVKRQRG